MASTLHYSVLTFSPQFIDLQPGQIAKLRCLTAKLETRRTTPSSEHSRTFAQNTGSQSFSFMPRLANSAERLRQRAKVKAHKIRGSRRTSVRRSDEGRRATPRLALWRNRSGFSYLGVLILTAVMSVALMGTGRYWSTIVKREREAELLYRGDQIRRAIGSYYNNPPGGQNKTYPSQFSDLLKDPRFPNLKRHLRKWYPDPMTQAGEWVYVLDASQRLKGVHSASEGEPIKKGNFPKDYKSFETAQTYADWTFVYVPRKQ